MVPVSYTHLDVYKRQLPDSNTDWISIQTPFIGLFNDVIELYAQKKGDIITLSDNGDTFHNLELVGASLNRAGERKNIAERILLNYGVHLKDNELYLSLIHI